MSDLGDKYSKQFGVPVERIVVSKTMLSRILGVDAKTIDAWARDTPPLPSLVRGAQQPKRIEWVYDLKAVVEWVRDRAYRNGLADAGSAAATAIVVDPTTGEPVEVPEHLMTRDQLMREITWFDLKDRRLDFEIRRGQVLYTDQAETILGQVLGAVSERLRMMMSKSIARLVRSGMARVEAERLIQEPVYEMIDELSAIDITKDPLEADKEAVEATGLGDPEMKDEADAGTEAAAA